MGILNIPKYLLIYHSLLVGFFGIYYQAKIPYSMQLGAWAQG